MAVIILSADVAAASKKSGKNLRCLLMTDITSVIDADENELPADDVRLCFVLVMKLL